jgi:hypothetical protein
MGMQDGHGHGGDHGPGGGMPTDMFDPERMNQ